MRVYQAGQYEDPLSDNSTWLTGDWNGDRDFDSGDLIAAYQAGWFETGPLVTRSAPPVPEPAGVGPLTLLLLAGAAWC